MGTTSVSYDFIKPHEETIWFFADRAGFPHGFPSLNQKGTGSDIVAEVAEIYIPIASQSSEKEVEEIRLLK